MNRPVKVVSNSNKYLFVLIALFVIPISGVSIDIYVPSLPAVSHYFNVDKALIQLSITFYMVGLGLMQLFAGGISDSFGRKKPFLITMLIYIIATLLITLSTNVYQLLFLRAVQGITVGVIVVSMRSVIPDLFEGKELHKMMNYMVMAWSIGPIIAPAIGGYLQDYFGWKANFYFLSIYSLLAFSFVLIYLPETSLNRHPFHVGTILKRYKEIVFHREFLTGLLINGLLYSLIILFAIVAPFLIQTILHYSATQFGYISLFVGLAWFLGSMSNRLLININLKVKTKICLFVMLCISFIMLLAAIFFPVNLYSIIIPVFLIIGFGGIIFPNYFAHSVALFPKTSGSANALFGAFTFLISSLSSGLGTFLKSTNQLSLTLAYIGIISLCLFISYCGIRSKY